MRSKLNTDGNISLRRHLIALYNKEKQKIGQDDIGNNSKKAVMLFNIFLQFIIENNWEYYPEGNLLTAKKILSKNYSEIQQVNCFELTDTFIAVCKQIGILKASRTQINHKAGKKIGEKFSEFSPPLMPFDKNTSTFTNNQFIFDKHCVANVEGNFYDLAFSTYFNDINAPFDNSINGQIVGFIDENNEEEAIRLLRENPTIDLTETFHGWTLLHRAADKGLFNVADCLVKLGVDVTIKSTELIPNIPLAYVPVNCVEDIQSELFKMLSKNIDILLVENIINNKFAVMAMDMVFKGNFEGLKSSIESGLNINSQDEHGWTLLHQAVTFEKIEMMTWLIENNADANIENNEGHVPLEIFYNVETQAHIDAFELIASRTDKQIARPDILLGAMGMISQGDFEALKSSIESGLNINSQNVNGCTLLHQAVIFAQTEIVSWLIENNADANIENDEGHVPLEIFYHIETQAHIDAFESIASRTDKQISRPDILWGAMAMISQGDLKGLESIIESGLNINCQNEDGWTLLHQAVIFEQIEMITWLVANNADANIENNEGHVPLDIFYHVESQAHIDAFELLGLLTNKKIVREMPVSLDTQSVIPLVAAQMSNEEPISKRELFKAVPEFTELYDKIEVMKAYGDKLLQLNEPKGTVVIKLADELDCTLMNFLRESINSKPSQNKINQFNSSFSQLVHSKDPEMHQHRAIWKPILANILIALTGVGFVAIVIKAATHAYEVSQQKKQVSFNQSFFFAKTKSQKIGDDIDDSLKFGDVTF